MKPISFVAPLLILGLTACPTPAGSSTGNTSGSTPGSIFQKGSVGLISFGSSIISFGGSFNNFPNGTNPDPTLAVPNEACTVSLTDTKPPPAPTVPGVGPVTNFTEIDAGPQLELRDASGAIILSSTKITGRIGSYFASGANIPLGSGGTLNIPGGAAGGFPAFTINFPTFPPALIITPTTSSANSETNFKWAVSASPSNLGLILFVSQKNDTEVRSVVCYTKDDGDFTFPAATKAEMIRVGLTAGTEIYASRTFQRTETKTNASVTFGINQFFFQTIRPL